MVYNKVRQRTWREASTMWKGAFQETNDPVNYANIEKYPQGK